MANDQEEKQPPAPPTGEKPAAPTPPEGTAPPSEAAEGKPALPPAAPPKPAAPAAGTPPKPAAPAPPKEAPPKPEPLDNDLVKRFKARFGDAIREAWIDRKQAILVVERARLAEIAQYTDRKSNV